MNQMVEMPIELVQAFEAAAEARIRFEQLPYSHRKEYIQWIMEAKKPETRARRVTGTIERLLTDK